MAPHARRECLHRKFYSQTLKDIRNRWNYNIKLVLQEMSSGDVKWNYFAWDMFQFRDFTYTVMSSVPKDSRL
jgi:hypothetical protein